MTGSGADRLPDPANATTAPTRRRAAARDPDIPAAHLWARGTRTGAGGRVGEPSPWLGNLAELWRQPWAADAVASRDIAAVYRLLQQVGVSQRRIGVLTGQSQSEVSEILAGRQVRDIRVLTRIVDGLDLPRAAFGLAPAAHEDDAADDDGDGNGVTESAGGLPVRCQCGGRLDAEELPAASLDEIPGSVDLADSMDAVPTPLIEVATEQGFRRLTVPLWSGFETRLLRLARRMSVRQFADHLGVSDRMVSKWEAAGRSLVPRPLNQDTLDTSLNLASLDQRARFAVLWRQTWPTSPTDRDRPPTNGPHDSTPPADIRPQ